jgi:phosphonoacetaldehyde hydrolase
MPKLSASLPAVVLDWAGTTIDQGCMAPVFALQAVLRREGIPTSIEELRLEMGLPKRDHLRSILSHHGMTEFTDRLYPELEREMLVQVAARTDLIPGVAAAVAWLRAEGIAIGTTTGYSRVMLERILPAAAAQGYAPDAVVTPDDVPAGRPAPFMMYANALRLGVWPLSRFVKVGDTPSDIAEGRNAGAWTIGVALTGNALGLTEPEIQGLSAGDRSACFSAARSALLTAGAHEVIDGLEELPQALTRLARHVADGRRP